jgi:hypothetical protein
MPQFVCRDFLHVTSSSGATNSICMHCLILVGTEGTETQLEQAENSHVCPGFSFTRILHPEVNVRHSRMSVARE